MQMWRIDRKIPIPVWIAVGGIGITASLLGEVRSVWMVQFVGIEIIHLMGELPHGLSHGTAYQETLIRTLSYSSAPTGLTCFGFLLFGLRKD